MRGTRLASGLMGLALAVAGGQSGVATAEIYTVESSYDAFATDDATCDGINVTGVEILPADLVAGDQLVCLQIDSPPCSFAGADSLVVSVKGLEPPGSSPSGVRRLILAVAPSEVIRGVGYIVDPSGSTYPPTGYFGTGTGWEWVPSAPLGAESTKLVLLYDEGALADHTTGNTVRRVDYVALLNADPLLCGLRNNSAGTNQAVELVLPEPSYGASLIGGISSLLFLAKPRGCRGAAAGLEENV